MAKRAMTVDDSRTMRDMVAFTLRGAGFEVSQAEDGQQALTLLKTTTVDVLITDLNMPVMDGVTLIRAAGGSEMARAADPDADHRIGCQQEGRGPQRRRHRLAGQAVQPRKADRSRQAGLRVGR